VNNNLKYLLVVNNNLKIKHVELKALKGS